MIWHDESKNKLENRQKKKKTSAITMFINPIITSNCGYRD